MPDPIRMGVIGIDHRHVYTMITGMKAEGAELAGWWTDGTPTTLEGFLKRFPDAPRMDTPEHILDDGTIDLILTAAIPSDRTEIAIRAMRCGKDVMVDKPGCLSLQQSSNGSRRPSPTPAGSGPLISRNGSRCQP